nr:hypothetical protein [uncultured Allomuricauda sp.]
MGIGRRNFLQLSTTALAGFAVNPLQAVVTNKDFYLNQKLGLAFYKPNGWQFLSIQDMGEIKSQIKLADEWKGLEDIVWEYSGEPICVMTKYDQNNPVNLGVYSPSITVWAEPKSAYMEDEIFTLDEFAESWTMQRLGYVLEPTVVERSDTYKISGMDACHYLCEFTLENNDLPEPLKAEVQMMYVEHDQFFYCFDFTDSIEANEQVPERFKEFRGRICII